MGIFEFAQRMNIDMTQFTHGHALVIGIGADLPNTVDDAVGLADILKDPERCAYPPGQVRMLGQRLPPMNTCAGPAFCLSLIHI